MRLDLLSVPREGRGLNVGKFRLTTRGPSAGLGLDKGPIP